MIRGAGVTQQPRETRWRLEPRRDSFGFGCRTLAVSSLPSCQGQGHVSWPRHPQPPGIESCGGSPFCELQPRPLASDNPNKARECLEKVERDITGAVEAWVGNFIVFAHSSEGANGVSARTQTLWRCIGQCKEADTTGVFLGLEKVTEGVALTVVPRRLWAPAQRNSAEPREWL